MKLRAMCKSKIHHATVTGADLHYVGSIGIDAALLRLTDIVPGEQVSLWNVNNGQRIETYAIALPEGSGQMVVNGAAARHFQPGDAVIIVAFCLDGRARRAPNDRRRRAEQVSAAPPRRRRNEELEDVGI